jgi:hypothetical protein
MKFKYLAILAIGSGLAVLGVEPLRAQPAAADTTERVSPLDSNPACMERNGPACVTDEVGLRRVVAPPLASPVTVLSTPTTPAAPAGSQLGTSATRPSNPQFNGAVVVIPTTPVPAPGSSTAPNVPAADQTGDFSAGRSPSSGSSGTGVTVIPNTPAPGMGSATAPNVPAADQTGDFSAGRTRSTPGQSPSAGSNGAGSASTSGAANSGATMSNGVGRR